MQKYVVLPESASRVYEIPDDILSPSQRTVLILEDDAAFAALLKEDLESDGYQVAIVPTGAEGVQQILASDFDAIVCDMVMPSFPGDMFYLAVQRIRPHLCRRFIFITGHQDNPKTVQFIKQTKSEVLWKPFELRQLLSAIESVIRGTGQPAMIGTVNFSTQATAEKENFNAQPANANFLPAR